MTTAATTAPISSTMSSAPTARRAIWSTTCSTTRRWAPGDVYYASALAYQTRRPFGDVVKMYEQDRGQGWGVIAQRMGIKPGSAEFHALKGNVGKASGRYKSHPGKGNQAKGGYDDGPGEFGNKAKGTTDGQGTGQSGNSDKGKPDKGKGNRQGQAERGPSLTEADSQSVTHRGGCHCRRVVFEVDAPAALVVQDCNCSMCRMSGFLHLIVPAARFRLLSGPTTSSSTPSTPASRSIASAACAASRASTSRAPTPMASTSTRAASTQAAPPASRSNPSTAATGNRTPDSLAHLSQA